MASVTATTVASAPTAMATFRPVVDFRGEATRAAGAVEIATDETLGGGSWDPPLLSEMVVGIMNWKLGFPTAPDSADRPTQCLQGPDRSSRARSHVVHFVISAAVLIV